MTVFLWIVFGLSILFTAYVIVFYPLLVSLLAKVRRREPKRAPITPTVSIIVAAHNGAEFLQEKLDSILSLDYPADRMEVIVVNDGSTDQTPQIALAYSDSICLINSPRVGKAGAISQGLQAATGEIIVLTDVRQTLASDSLRRIMENFADPAVGVVSAELQISQGSSHEEANTGAYWKYEKWIRLNLSAIDSIFGATGSYYAVRRELAIPIPRNTLNDDMYLPLHAFFRGYRLVVDARAKMYDYPTKLAAEFNRKVRTLAGNYQILRQYPELITPQNRMWLHFLSYKLGRLLLPFALITAAISSLFLGERIAIFSLLLQLFVYGAAIVDPRIAPTSRLKGITSPIKTFIVMMLATICATSIWFVPPERLWKTTHVSSGRATVRGVGQG